MTQLAASPPRQRSTVLSGLYHLVTDELSLYRRIRGPTTLEEALFAPAPRTLDSRPWSGPGSGVPGAGRVGFALDTGGDQMGVARETGLQAFAEWRTGSSWQTLASCSGAGIWGSGMAQVAACDGRSMALVIAGAELRVLEQGAVIASIPIPDDVAFTDDSGVMDPRPGRRRTE